MIRVFLIICGMSGLVGVVVCIILGYIAFPKR